MKKIIVIAAVLLAGCATSYKPEGLRGGFSEAQLDVNVFRVSVRGNGYTHADRVEEMALLRSSEIALEHGFKYFVIVNARASEKTQQYQDPAYATTVTTGVGTSVAHSSTFVSGGGTYNISKPSITNTIVCLNDQPKDVFSYNAQFVFNSLSAKYKK